MAQRRLVNLALMDSFRCSGECFVTFIAARGNLRFVAEDVVFVGCAISQNPSPLCKN